MANGYIIEEIRATTWSVRLRDQQSGKVIDVPLEPGGSWTPPASPRNERTPPVRHERETGEHGGPTGPGTTEHPERTEFAGQAEAKKADAPRKPRGDKNERRNKVRGPKSARTAKPTVSEGPARDEPTAASENTEAQTKRQAGLRHMRSRRAGKMGGLGWDETTDAGRSGLIGRSGQGAYKILHAGGDTYALFYEWDNGQFERLACGSAEDLMDLATERARGGPPEPPPTALSLELARVLCGNKKQDPASAPPESAESTERSNEPPREPDPQPSARRTRRATPPEPSAPEAEAPVDATVDQQLIDSLKRALEEME